MYRKLIPKKYQLPSVSVEGLVFECPRALVPLSSFAQVQYSLTSIKGVGRRFSNLICKKAEVDPNKRRECKPVPHI